MLKKLKIHNFKSLVDFEIELKPFTVLIGPNASGKSTILQAIDFIKWFGEGDPKGFLKQRDWESKDIRSKLTRDRNTNFNIRFKLDDTDFLWRFRMHFSDVDGPVCINEDMGLIVVGVEIHDPEHGNLSGWKLYLRVLSHSKDGIGRLYIDEIIEGNNYKQLSSIDDIVTALKNGFQQPLTSRQVKEASQDIPPFGLNGSVLSMIRMNNADDIRQFPIHGIIRKYLSKFHSLELLAPEKLRQKSREEHADLGITGKYLAAYLHDLPKETRNNIDTYLQRLYTKAEHVGTVRRHAGWTEVSLVELLADKFIEISPKHISDGILRIIAILAALEGLDNGSTILIDEIENGIYPDLAHGFIKAVREIAEKKNFQVIATTHSPAILNAWPDESIIFVWRDDKGHVKAEPLFEDPEMKERLEYMSSGAIWHNTPMSQIIETLEIQHARKKTNEDK